MANFRNVTAHIPASEFSKLSRALEGYAKESKRRMIQGRAYIASRIQKDAREGFAGNYEEDVHRVVIGAAPMPTPPYKEQSTLMPHVRTGTMRKEGGLLRSTIRIERDGDDYLVKAGGGTAPYAAFVEYGTVTARPHPFMFPAAEMNRRDFQKMMRDALKHKGKK